MHDVILYIRSLGPLDVALAALDVAVVAYAFYRFLLLVRGTRALQLLKGLFILFLLTFLSRVMQLETVNWLLQTAQLSLAVALPVVFQPELRRALEQVGRGRFFSEAWNAAGSRDLESFLDELLGAAKVLSEQRIGAIIVVERETGLNDIIETGIRVEGRVSREFLINIFVPDTPLHDGAVIIRGNRIMAAACYLPLTEPQNVPTDMGSRHRAALGISEQTDAVVLVVSEETGARSIALGGKLMKQLDSKTLRDMMAETLGGNEDTGQGGGAAWTVGFRRKPR